MNSDFICEKREHCVGCNYEYADRIEDIEPEFRECEHLVEAHTVVRGKWLHRFVSGEDPYECSVCGNYVSAYGYRYCPHCGSKMEEGEWRYG